MTDQKQQVTLRICPDCGREYDQQHQYCPEDGTRLRDLGVGGGELVDDPLLGADIDDRFHIEAVLGEGGMGKVYRGKQLSVHRDVAIKVLHSKLANDQTLVKRFFREAQVISQFSHPNIVNLVDFGRDAEHGVLYLAMEYIDGTELTDLIEQGARLAPEFAVEIVRQACEALSEPHSNGVIHRDLKPENLMLVPISSGKIQAKIVDFGIAHALHGETKLTKTGMVFGTAQYMAPEQAAGDEVRAGTDIYALGCICYELLAGRLPFEGDQPMQLLMSHVQDDPPILADLAPGDEQFGELSALIRQMMSKSPEDRPESVLQVRDRLERIQRDHRHPSLRVDLDEHGARMFDPWIYESLEASGQRPPSPETNAPISGHDTGEYGGTSFDTTTAEAPTFPEEHSAGLADTLVDEPVVEAPDTHSGAHTTPGNEEQDDPVGVDAPQDPKETPSTDDDRRTGLSTELIAAQLRGPRSRWLVAVGGVAALLAVGGLVAALVLSNGESGENDSPSQQEIAASNSDSAQQDHNAQPAGADNGDNDDTDESPSEEHDSAGDGGDPADGNESVEDDHDHYHDYHHRHGHAPADCHCPEGQVHGEDGECIAIEDYDHDYGGESDDAAEQPDEQPDEDHGSQGGDSGDDTTGAEEGGETTSPADAVRPGRQTGSDDQTSQHEEEDGLEIFPMD